VDDLVEDLEVLTVVNTAVVNPWEGTSDLDEFTDKLVVD
jgi:hypothetical protein